MLPFDPADLSYTPLSAECPREVFSCGQEIVDRWFKEKADGHHDHHRCRVTTVHAPGDDCPVAFYALAIVAERLTDKWSLIETFFPNDGNYFPSLRLEWIAVRADLQGNGLGTIVMGRVLTVFKDLVASTGIPAITLKPINEQTAAFYKKLDFVSFGAKALGPRMLLPASKVIEAKALLVEQDA